MLDEERMRLADAAAEGAYMSIAINEDGQPVRGGFVPWESTASAFNMQTPEVTLAMRDLYDPAIMECLRKCVLCGVYILVPLDDYSFLSAFSELRDLFIRHGENMRDLSFIKNMPHLFMFYLENADIPDLKPLVENCNAGEMPLGKCLGFYHCNVKDTSALKEARFVVSELLVWPVEGDCRERWEVRHGVDVVRYYEG